MSDILRGGLTPPGRYVRHTSRRPHPSTQVCPTYFGGGLTPPRRYLRHASRRPHPSREVYSRSFGATTPLRASSPSSSRGERPDRGPPRTGFGLRFSRSHVSRASGEDEALVLPEVGDAPDDEEPNPIERDSSQRTPAFCTRSSALRVSALAALERRSVTSRRRLQASHAVHAWYRTRPRRRGGADGAQLDPETIGDPALVVSAAPPRPPTSASTPARDPGPRSARGSRAFRR